MNPPRETGLWEAVYAAPDEVAPRRVLAEALMERGDPYGEYLQRANHPRGGALVALREAATPAFLGSLRAVFSPRLTWKAGLLHAVRTVHADPGALEATRDHPFWGTIREVTISGRSDRRMASNVAWLATQPRWRWLEHVTLNAPAHFQALAQHPTFGVSSLRIGFFSAADAPRLADPAVFPELRELELDTVPMGPGSEPGMHLLLQRPLEVFGLGLHPATFAAWVRRLEGAGVRRVRFRDGSWEMVVDPRSWEWSATPLRNDSRRGTVRGLLRRVDLRFKTAVVFTG